MPKSLETIISEPSAIRERWLSIEDAVGDVVYFEERFGTDHLKLACHVALPLILDAKLINLIHINFLYNEKIPWIAESDFLLSSLCRPIGGDLFEVEPTVREVLLAELESNYGWRRLLELSEFLLAYSGRRNKHQEQRDVMKFHHWIALAYIDPDSMIREASSILEESLSPEEGSAEAISKQIHITNIVEMTAEPLLGSSSREEYENLISETRIIARGLYEDERLRKRIAQDISDEANSIQISPLILKWVQQKEKEEIDLAKADFSNRKLTEVPTEIFKLGDISDLDLSYNELINLPPGIVQLQNLTSLNLSNNNLTELPSEIGQLANLTSLDLSNNNLTELPSEIGQLTNLTSLNLSNNSLTELPSEIGQLANLTSLDLSNNSLTELPSEIAQLTNLTGLDLSFNQLTELPPEIWQLTDLILLYISNIQLTELPPEIAQLTNLMGLDLSSNQLTELPPEIAQLVNLTELYLDNNQLMELSPEIGQLAKLRSLYFDENPLVFPPPEIIEQGRSAVLYYLREQFKASRQQWVSKLLIVGEGGVGKTCLLRSLRGEPFQIQSRTTYGIDVSSLELEHPSEADATMQLNCWDFAGQEISHATHQFFLTGRSIFLLVWNARHGYEQGKLLYWLDAIQASAPESPVIIVATHIDQRGADLPLGEVRVSYPQIVGHYAVSNSTGAGIEDLRDALMNTAANLPLMGERWPAHWLNAAEAMRNDERKYITPAKLRKLMKEHNVAGRSADTLVQWLHELGDILYFTNDDELNDLIILKPQWVTEYIHMVLESPEVIDGLGIFTRNHMRQLWSDLSIDIQDHFLKLMEQFDLSYRTLEDRDISLVVECLPIDPPEYQGHWDSARGTREVSMRFRLNTIQAGIPTWFIARSHRFTTNTHWRNGALLADTEEQRHLALIRVDHHERNLQLTVRGPSPYNFFTLLRDGVEVTLRRYPGLKIDRMIPCPGHNGEPCDYEFNYAHILKAAERVPPIEKVQCGATFENVSVSDLLFGIHFSTQDEVLNQMAEMEKTIVVKHDETLAKQDEILLEIGNLRELTQRGFTSMYQMEQEKIDSQCPNVFVIRPRDKSNWRQRIIGKNIELQLYCQAPGQWHPYGMPYIIKKPAEWIKATAPYLQKMVGVLKYVAPLPGPWVSMAMPEYEKLIKNDLELMTELVKKRPDLKADHSLELAEEIGEDLDLRKFEGAELRAVRQLLEELDPDQKWGELKKVLTPEGHYLWLCPYHAEEYKK